MLKSLRGRIIVILAILAGCFGYLYTNGLKLGLDLQGGMHLVLEVEDPDGTMTPEARADAIDRAERIIRTRIDEFGVEEPLIQQVGDERLVVQLAGIDDEDRAKSIIEETAFLEWKLVRPIQDLEPALARIDRTIVASLGRDSLEALGQAVEAPTDEGAGIEQLLFGGDTVAEDAAGEATDEQEGREGAPGGPGGGEATPREPEEEVAEGQAEEGDGQEGVDVPDARQEADAESDELSLRPFTTILNQGDFPGTYVVAVEDVPTAQLFMDLPAFQRALPRNIRLHWDWQTVAMGAREYRRLYVLEEEPFLTGDMLEDATAGRDAQFNQAQVQFELTRAGGRRFSDVTGQHIGDNIAIVLDREVVSAPTVRDRIGARGQIDMGQAPLEEARDLALVLRAGALPAPLQIMEERTVGPSLGQDSIEQGELAGIVGLILVVVVMIGYYRMAGALAVGALMVYVALVLGGLSALNATLTVPGIAGLILSVGMAVDANVLIFERIREELEAGRATRKAVDEGFAHALSAIVDANLTTLITALILFQFGTGPVRGFAVTLSIGIVASFFSALYVTRTFFLIYLRGKKATDPISV